VTAIEVQVEKGCQAMDTTQTAHFTQTTPTIDTHTIDTHSINDYNDTYLLYESNYTDTSDTTSSLDTTNIPNTINSTEGRYSDVTTNNNVNPSEDIYSGGLKCWDTAVKEASLKISHLLSPSPVNLVMLCYYNW
jgi:hypothetical protein